MKTRALRWVSASLLGGAVVLLLGSGVLAWELRRPYVGWSGASTTVELAPGLDAGSMLQRLGQAGVLRRPDWVRAWLVIRGGAGALQAGEYRFERPVAPLEVLDKLRRGDVVLHPVTLPEGLDAREVALRVAEAGFGTPEELLRMFDDPGPIAEWDAQASELEGYLFPDTYRLPRSATPQTIAATMVARFLEVVGDDFAERARAVGLTPRQAVTLASLIEKETSVPEERRRISRVFHNRLARAMKLQCDPTVIYALRREGQEVPRLTLNHLEFDSPWNTYAYPGLPPGPICSPGGASLHAAVEPAEGDELYFVAAPEGGHTFSNDLAGHLAAVRVWRRHQRTMR